MPYQAAYPTMQHARAAEAVTELFAGQPGVEAVLLMGSCARGKASPDSCLDILILSRPGQDCAPLEALWAAHYPADPVFQDQLQVGAFSQVDLEFIDGDFRIPYHGWTSGADEFELEVGNTLAYTVPLWEGGGYYRELQARWLPYYDEDLRRERLDMALRFCRNNLAHIPLYAPRGLYFQCFKRFYHAFEEFLQALFIARRVYPIAYDKWVKEQIVEILGEPELYARLTRLLEIQQFESLEIVDKARQLGDLLDEYVNV